MMNTLRNRMNNEAGFTLVEVLATLAIFSVLMVLVMSTLFTTMQQNERVQETNQLQRDTNMIIMQMRNDYHNGSGTDSLTIPASYDDITVESLVINGVDKTGSASIMTEFDEPLDINITTKGAGAKEIEIHTIWQPVDTAVIDVTP